MRDYSKKSEVAADAEQDKNSQEVSDKGSQNGKKRTPEEIAAEKEEQDKKE
jgi:hypothetical protein